MHIRPERETDHEAIHRLVYDAFLGHPQHAPGALPHEPALVDALRADGALTLSLVAEDQGALVGHIAFSEVRVDGESVGWHGIGPVAVLPARQRQGVGSALIQQGIAELEQEGSRGIALVGDPAYYERFGFHADPALTLPGVPPQYVLILPLQPPTPSGHLTFHPAFGG